jgi:hypothetical protein
MKAAPIQTSEKLQADAACVLHFAIDIFGPPFNIKCGPLLCYMA